jgi:hypothetical protein
MLSPIVVWGETSHKSSHGSVVDIAIQCGDWAFRGSNLQLPVAERSRARVYGRLLAGIASSNPAGGMDVLCCVLYS